MAMLNNQRAIRTYADKPGGIEDLLVFFGTPFSIKSKWVRQILQNEPGQWALFFVLVQKVKRLLHSQYRKSRSPAHTQASSMQAPARDQRIEYRASANYRWQLIPAVGMQVDPRKKMNDQTTQGRNVFNICFNWSNMVPCACFWQLMLYIISLLSWRDQGRSRPKPK